MTRRLDRLLAGAGLAGPVLFVAGFTVAGWLRPGYSAARDAVSDLGVGGLVERALAGEVFASHTVMGWRLRREARSGPARPATPRPAGRSRGRA